MEETTPKTNQQKIESLKEHIEFLTSCKKDSTVTTEMGVHIADKIKTTINKLTELVFLENTGAKY